MSEAAPLQAEATILGRIMIRDLQTGEIYPGDNFRITFTDDCCEGHAASSCQSALQGYLDWHNQVSLERDTYEFFADEYITLQGPQAIDSLSR